MSTAEAPGKRPPARKKAQQLARSLRGERPDYAYLKQVFRCLREELGVPVARAPKRLPVVPSEEELRCYYEAVWQARRMGDLSLRVLAEKARQRSRGAAHAGTLR